MPSNTAVLNAQNKLYEEKVLCCAPRNACHRCWCIFCFVFIAFSFGLFIPAPKNVWYQLVRTTANNTTNEAVTIYELQYLSTKAYRMCTPNECIDSPHAFPEYGSLDSMYLKNVGISQGLQGLSFVYGCIVFLALALLSVLCITPSVTGSPEKIRKKQLERWENLIKQGIQPTDTDVPIKDGRYHYLILFLSCVLGTALGFHATVEFNTWIYTPISQAIRDAKLDKYVPPTPYSPSKELLSQYTIQYSTSYTYLMFATICGIVCSCCALLSMACAFKWLCCVSRDSFRTPTSYEIDENLRQLRNANNTFVNPLAGGITNGQFVINSPLQHIPLPPPPSPPPPPPPSSSSSSTDPAPPPPGIRYQRDDDGYVPPSSSVPNDDEITNPSSSSSNTVLPPPLPPPPVPSTFLPSYRSEEDRHIVTIPVPWSPYIPPNLAPLNPYVYENELTYHPSTPNINTLYSSSISSDYYIPSNRIAPPRVVSPLSFANRSTVPSSTTTTGSTITDGSRYRSRYDAANDSTPSRTPSATAIMNNRSVTAAQTRTPIYSSSSATVTNTNTPLRNADPAVQVPNPLRTLNRTITANNTARSVSMRNNTRITNTAPTDNVDDDENDTELMNVIQATAVRPNHEEEEEVPTSGPDYSTRTTNNNNSARITMGYSGSGDNNAYYGSPSRSSSNTGTRTNSTTATSTTRLPPPSTVSEPEEIEDDDPT